MAAMKYVIEEVDALASAEIIHFFNGLATDIFPPLTERHLRDGFWWLAFWQRTKIVGFTGLVPLVPFEDVGYLKRAYVLPEHRGQGLQLRFIQLRECKAKELGWSLLVTETSGDNLRSQSNMLAAGFEKFDPEQRWGAPGSAYFKKSL